MNNVRAVASASITVDRRSLRVVPPKLLHGSHPSRQLGRHVSSKVVSLVPWAGLDAGSSVGKARYQGRTGTVGIEELNGTIFGGMIILLSMVLRHAWWHRHQARIPFHLKLFSQFSITLCWCWRMGRQRVLDSYLTARAADE